MDIFRTISLNLQGHLLVLSFDVETFTTVAVQHSPCFIDQKKGAKEDTEFFLFFTNPHFPSYSLCMQKKKCPPKPHTLYKSELKMGIDLNVKHKTFRK